MIEVVIAVGLLVTLAAGVAQLFAMSATSLVRGGHRTSSLALTVEKLEQVRAELATEVDGRVPIVMGPQVEHLDPHGRLTAGGLEGSRYERIWRIGPERGSVVTVTVQVAPVLSSGPGSLDGAVPPDGARLVTLVPAW